YRASDDLGRYSTGLKSATKSFCDSIYVSSKQKNEIVHTIQIDYEHIIKNNEWGAFIVNDFSLGNELTDSGTIVYCEKLNFIKDTFQYEQIYNRIDELEKSLSHIFGKYILENKIEITIQFKGS